jgi:hypothetical protein
VNSSQNGSKISEVRDFVATLSQVVVAVVSARLALFALEPGFGYGGTPGGMPVGSEMALDAILGVILLLGAGLGLVLCRFPLYVMLSIPPLIRVFMLRPVRRELSYVALVVGAYTDLVFTIGAAGGVFFGRWWRRRTSN